MDIHIFFGVSSFRWLKCVSLSVPFSSTMLSLTSENSHFKAVWCPGIVSKLHLFLCDSRSTFSLNHCGDWWRMLSFEMLTPRDCLKSECIGSYSLTNQPAAWTLVLLFKCQKSNIMQKGQTAWRQRIWEVCMSSKWNIDASVSGTYCLRCSWFIVMWYWRWLKQTKWQTRSMKICDWLKLRCSPLHTKFPPSTLIVTRRCERRPLSLCARSLPSSGIFKWLIASSINSQSCRGHTHTHTHTHTHRPFCCILLWHLSLLLSFLFWAVIAVAL